MSDRVEKDARSQRSTFRPEECAVGGTVGDWIDDTDNRPAPAGEASEQLRVTVQDPEGLSCDSAAWVVRMLCLMDASVWVVHDKAGSIHLTDRGRWMPGAERLWARFCAGEKLTIVATGPQATEALKGVRVMLSAPAGERKALYRARYLRRPSFARRDAIERRGSGSA